VSQLPIHPSSPEEQQRIMEQLYLLMGKQVQSYHRQRRMGSSSSVPVELAQELMESVAYTVGLVGGAHAHSSIEEALRLGQEILKSRLTQAGSILKLVSGTAPQWQTECRCEALGCLRRYLDHYDPLHLAHRGPEDLFYPILIATPEGIQGIDSCIFYLNILWIENQIMAGVPENSLEQFWNRLPAATLNPCEQLLINGIGKAILGNGLDPLIFEAEENMRLIAALTGETEERLRESAGLLCQWLDLRDENARMYVEAVIPCLSARMGNPFCGENWEGLFI